MVFSRAQTRFACSAVRSLLRFRASLCALPQGLFRRAPTAHDKSVRYGRVCGHTSCAPGTDQRLPPHFELRVTALRKVGLPRSGGLFRERRSRTPRRAFSPLPFLPTPRRFVYAPSLLYLPGHRVNDIYYLPCGDMCGGTCLDESEQQPSIEVMTNHSVFVGAEFHGRAVEASWRTSNFPTKALSSSVATAHSVGIHDPQAPG